jgi:MFS family permease
MGEAMADPGPVVSSTAVILVYFVGAYFVPVLLAFALVQRFGRRFHESDAMAILAPYVSYYVTFALDPRHTMNVPWALFASGCVVAVCMPLRLLSWLAPWSFAGLTIGIGIVAAYLVYMTIRADALILPI